MVEHSRWSLPATTRPGLVSPVRIDPTGVDGPTLNQVRSKRWRRTSWGLHVPAEVELTVEQRIIEAAALLPPGSGAVTGWAALRWEGAGWFGGELADGSPRPVDLATRRKLRPRAGIQLCEEGIIPDELHLVDGLLVTQPVRSVAYAMRHATCPREAVIIFDMAAYADLVSFAEMVAYAGLAPRLGLSSWLGMPQYRKAVVLGSENAWSPQEVTMRLIWVLDAGLPTPLANQPVFDLSGHHIGTPDLLDVEAGVVGEYDGALHLEGTRRRADRQREERFRDAGLEYFTMMAGDSSRPAVVAERMVAARRRARWSGPDTRRWTVDPPPWWTPTTTVDQRRALTDEQRSRFLRYRTA